MMDNSFDKIIHKLRTLINNNEIDNYKIIFDYFQELKFTNELNEGQLNCFIETMCLFLNYNQDSSEELYIGYKKTDHLKAFTLRKVQECLLKSDIPINCSGKAVSNYLKSLFKYLKSSIITFGKAHKTNTLFDDLFWNILNDNFAPIYQEIFSEFIVELEKANYRPTGFLNELKEIITLRNEDIGNKDWSYCNNTILPLLDHYNYLKRAEGAKRLGKYYSLLSNPLGETPSLTKTLVLIAEKEIEHRGVAGAFIDGLDDSCMGLSCLHYDYKNDLEEHFDPKAWILNILKYSKGEEIYTPNAQSFEFYAHEYFEDDPDAINELIDMGKEDLALYAATNSYTQIPKMRNVLKRLSKSRNNIISKSAIRYLESVYYNGTFAKNARLSKKLCK